MKRILTLARAALVLMGSHSGLLALDKINARIGAIDVWWRPTGERILSRYAGPDLRALDKHATVLMPLLIEHPGEAERLSYYSRREPIGKMLAFKLIDTRRWSQDRRMAVLTALWPAHSVDFGRSRDKRPRTQRRKMVLADYLRSKIDVARYPALMERLYNS